MSIIVRFLRWLLRLFGLGKPSVETITVPHQGQAPPPPKHPNAPLAPQAAAKPTTTVDESAPLPYQVQDSLLKVSELNFYRVLQSVVGTTAVICPKVKLGDIFAIVGVGERPHYYHYLGKINSKHVDFLLCSPHTMRPLVGIELDDKSHRRTERQERDAFVNKVFDTAGLPLLRVPVQYAYVPEALRTAITPHLLDQPPALDTAITIPSAPTCPKCGKPMVRRTAKQGRFSGQMFWGCTGFPDCKTRLPYTEE